MSNEQAKLKGEPNVAEVTNLLKAMQILIGQARVAAEDVAGQVELAKHNLSPLQAALRIVALRRKRDEVFRDYCAVDVFSEPVWEMLLDLYIAGRTGKLVCVSSLCIAARVPATTAIRHINIMVEQGVFIKAPDAADSRRIWISLSGSADSAMEKILTYQTE